MKLLADISGQLFGRLKALEFAGKRGWHDLWLCECTCGVRKTVMRQDLLSGNTRSCGCLRKEVWLETRAKQDLNNPNWRVKHGMTGTPVYDAYRLMMARCYNKNCDNYPLYGGSGVTVCDRWIESFDNFYADVGDKPSPEMSLDRLECAKVYSPNTVSWSSPEQQARNRKKSKNNKSGKTGVIWAKGKGSPGWQAFYMCPQTRKKRTKYFTIKKYGDAEAYRLASEWRDAMIDEINAQGAGYSSSHGK